jgi:hypothetical protein
MGNSASKDNFKIIKIKIQKTISTVFASMLMLVIFFTASNSFAQTKTKPAMVMECCMMKGGKTMPMEKDMTMKNGNDDLSGK